MGTVSYSDALKHQETNFSSDIPYVGRFFLENDKDEAVVRILHDSADSFDVVISHNVMTKGKYRDISCLRDYSAPIADCPFCASGMKPRARMYIHLLEYTNDATGGVVVTPKVWDRHIGYAEKLLAYLDNYGPLSDIMCKIIRHGAKGDMQTVYEIVPNLSPKLYPDDIYVKDTSGFEGYKSVGSVVWTKSRDAMEFFVANNEFPAAVTSTTTAEEPNALDVEKTETQPMTQYVANVPTAQPSQNTPAPVVVAANTASRIPPWERSKASNVDKPIRTY